MIIFIRRIGFMVVMAVSVLGATILVGITEAANAQSTDSILDIFGEP